MKQTRSTPEKRNRPARLAPELVNNCPIRERTADGISVGRCLFYIGPNWICPRHGDVAAARLAYMETGKLQEES